MELIAGCFACDLAVSAGLEILRRCGDSSHKGLRIACTTWAMDIVVQYLYLYSRSRHVFIALLAVRVLGFLGDHPEHLDEMRRKEALSDMPRDLRDELLTAVDQVRTRLGRGGDDASNSGGRVGGDASCNNQFKICWPREKLIDDLRSSNVDPLDHPDLQLEVIRKWTKHGKAKYYSNDNRCLYCLKQYHRDVIPSKVDGNTYQEVHNFARSSGIARKSASSCGATHGTRCRASSQPRGRRGRPALATAPPAPPRRRRGIAVRVAATSAAQLSRPQKKRLSQEKAILHIEI